ncbi:MAG: asparagine synthase-related protein, partial [Planctomycetota bacterium]
MLFAERVALLERRLGELPSLLVALSGGVDSAALLGSASRALPGRLLAATAKSPAVPDEEVRAAAAAARRLGVPHRVVETREMGDPAYTANDGERCYFCRLEMYGALGGLAAAEGLAAVADGL